MNSQRTLNYVNSTWSIINDKKVIKPKLTHVISKDLSLNESTIRIRNLKLKTETIKQSQSILSERKANSLSQTSLKLLAPISSPSMNKKENFGSFCPMCSHCNSMKDGELDTHINSVREAKNLLAKAAEFIIKNDYHKKTSLDFVKHSSEVDKSAQGESNPVMVDNLFAAYPQQMSANALNYRTVYQLLGNFLNALIDDKLSIEALVPPELNEKIQKSLLSKGSVFEENKSEVYFDPEVESLFDDRTREIIQALFKSNNNLV